MVTRFSRLTGWARTGPLLAMRIYIMAVFVLAGCGGLREAMEETRTAAEFAALDPADFFEPVGDFVPGRFTVVYVPVALQDADGEAIAPQPSRKRFVELAEADRAYIFGRRESPLKGTADRVNLVVAKAPFEVRLDAKGRAKLAAGAKASEVVHPWAFHDFLTGLVEAHGDWFGGDPQAVYQVPHVLRDQATWFRFDRVVGVADAAMSTWGEADWLAFAKLVDRETAAKGDPEAALKRVGAGMVSLTGVDRMLDAAFPKLRVPLVWHAVAWEKPGVNLAAQKEWGAVRSSVVLFHEFGHIGECRASDEYAEASMSEFLQNNPREAAVIGWLGKTVGAAELVAAADTHVQKLPFAGAVRGSLKPLLARMPKGGVNASSFLLGNAVSKRAVGKMLGHPNVLPDDAGIIAATWRKLPSFEQRLWDGAAKPKDGQTRMVSGGLYLKDHAFKRIQVFAGGEWRNTYMGDSLGNAPTGPVMDACLARWAKRIKRR